MKTCIIKSALAVAFVALISASAYAGGGNVQPPTAKPHGYSLTDMAAELAYFSTNGNDLAFYPDTPFQILYIDYSLPAPTTTFRVKTGTKFFVPIVFTTDSPLVLPIIFPDNGTTAGEYFFDPELLGGNIQIVVDGDVTHIGPGYAAGPVSTPGLGDGGSQFIQLGAFLTPLSKGRHTVTIRYVLDGDVILAAFGGPYAFDYNYTVIVK